MTSIVTVRHAATTFGRYKKIAGTLDAPLTEEGRALADGVGDSTLCREADVVIASPLSRALDTARLCTRRPVHEIVVSPLCIERNYGRMQGLLPDEVRRLRPPVRYVRVGNYLHSLNPPDGETFDQVRERAKVFVSFLLASYKGSCIFVFSHYAFLQQLHGELQGEDPYNCLGRDIHTLEFNYFQLDDAGRAEHVRCERPVRSEPAVW